MVFLAFTVLLLSALDTPFIEEKAKIVIFTVSEIAYIAICLMIIHFSSVV